MHCYELFSSLPLLLLLARSLDSSPTVRIWNSVKKWLLPSPNVVDLAEESETIWQEISQDIIRELYQSMPSQVIFSIQTRSGSMLYWLRFFIMVKLCNKSLELYGNFNNLFFLCMLSYIHQFLSQSSNSFKVHVFLFFFYYRECISYMLPEYFHDN